MSVACRPDNVDAQCTFDMGLNFSFFKSDAFTQVPPSLGKAHYATASGASLDCNFVDVPKLSVGNGFALEPIQPAVCPAAQAKAQSNLIGLDAVAGRSFVVDVKNSKLTFLDQAPVLENKFETDNFGHVLLNVTSDLHNPQNAVALFDTGAALSTIDMELVKAHPETYTIINAPGIGSDNFGNQIKTAMVMASYVKIDGVELVAEYFMAMDFTPIQKNSGKNIQMIIGYNAIKQGRWTFDMANSTWSAK